MGWSPIAIEGYQGVREKGGCRDEVARVCQNPGLLQVFVSGLDGRTLVDRVPGDLVVQDLESTYSDAGSDWYLMHTSKPLLSGPLSASVCHNARITMNGRLRGGMNSVPGAWFCPTCNQGGCWPARRSCFRCGQPRPAQPVPIPARPARRKKGFFREEQFLGRQPHAGSGGCSTTRVPPHVAPAPSVPPIGPLSPGEVSSPPVNAAMMLAWLRQLGLDTEVIEQVTSKLPPPQCPSPRKPERVVLDLANKKEQLQSALQKLEKRVQDQLRVMQEITDLQKAKSQELAKVSAEYDDALNVLGADIQTRRPPPPEEETGQDSEDFPPLEEHDDDMEDLEQSSKRQKSAPGSVVFSSDLVLSEMPTFGGVDENCRQFLSVMLR